VYNYFPVLNENWFRIIGSKWLFKITILVKQWHILLKFLKQYEYMAYQFPKNFTQQGNRNVCKAVMSDSGSLEEIKNSPYTQSSSTVSDNLTYAVKLGFLEKSDGRLVLSERGKKLVLSEEPDSLQELYREGISSFEGYQELTSHIIEERKLREKSGELAVRKSSLVDWFRENSESESESVQAREINTALRTLGSAGLGTFKVGRKGSETRLVVGRSEKQEMSGLVEGWGLEDQTDSSEDESEQKEDKREFDERAPIAQSETGDVNLVINITSDWSKEEVLDLISEVQN
jgi:hypothetical protein